MIRRLFGVSIVCLVLLATIAPALCDDSSDEKKDESGSSLGDIFRNVGTSIQEGAKKVGQTFQKGYQYVKKKVSEIGDDDDKPNEQANVTEIVKKPESETSDGEKTESTTADLDNRFLFDTPEKCPPGQKMGHGNHCRPA